MPIPHRNCGSKDEVSTVTADFAAPLRAWPNSDSGERMSFELPDGALIALSAYPAPCCGCG